MKTKTFNKRLQLNKQTIASLKTIDMGKLKGGACTCMNTGCRTWIWQECNPSATYLVQCDSQTIGTCC